jgi:Fe2+ or Zn2+ uptake regulation protein
MQVVLISDNIYKESIIPHMPNLSQHRLTSQRKALLKLIQEQGGYLDAVELYRRAQILQPRISLSTVYRALELFKKLGLVEEHRFEESHRHYEAKPQTKHYHLICLQCGKILEFQSPLTEELEQEINRREKFTVTTAQVQGYCQSCAMKRKENRGGRNFG